MPESRNWSSCMERLGSTFANASEFEPGTALAASDQLSHPSLYRRLLFVALLFAIEGIPLSNLVHKGRGAGALLQIAIVFVPLLVAISYVKSKATIEDLSAELRKVSIAWRFLALHAVSLVAFVSLCFVSDQNDSVLQAFLIAGWYLAGALTVGFLGLCFIPPLPALRLLRETRWTWIPALAIALLARRLIVYTSLGNGLVWNPALDLSWKPATDLTFSIVHALLRLILPNVIADRASMTIGTPGFHVEVTPWCAGFEGTALMLVFSAGWLAIFRREYRFPQALILVPTGMLVIWIANALRIWLLILIGVAGAPNVAINGFHSQAGWIAFNAVALGFVVFSRRVAWVTGHAPATAPLERGTSNSAAPYLMPFVVLMAVGMLATAASSGFELLYPLRVVAVLITVWCFRATLLKLDWRCGWFSALAGIAVFLLWLGLDRMSGPSSDSGIGPGLAALPMSGRLAWLAFRTIGAILTVPIAEELAFRGFLIRRVISADFHSLDPRRWTWLSILVSSLAFGVLHSGRWLAGSVAGLIYAWAFLRRGRIGDAVFAHALTNALLAVWVLSGSRWYLW